MPHWSSHQVARQAFKGGSVVAGIQRRADVDMESAVAPRVQQAQPLLGQQVFALQPKQRLQLESDLLSVW